MGVQFLKYRRCDNCIYYKAGDCRKNAPVVIPWTKQPDTAWPRVNYNDLCGQFEENLKEE